MKCTVCKNSANWQDGADAVESKRYEDERRARGASDERGREETDDFCISFRIPSYQTIMLQWLLSHHIFEPSFPCLAKLNGRERRN